MRKALIAILVLVALGYGLLLLSRSTTYQVFGQIISHGPRDRPWVAVTFDDGPDAIHTQTVLDILAENEAKATFFLVGHAIEETPDVARLIVEAGHEIGNHSYTHRRLVLVTPKTAREEVARTDAAIRAIGYQGPIPFRPAYGKKLFSLPWVLSQSARATIMWSMDPETHLGQDADANTLVQHVVTTAQAGDIILLHPMFSNARTRVALPGIIAGLRDRGFQLVTVSTLLGSDHGN